MIQTYEMVMGQKNVNSLTVTNFSFFTPEYSPGLLIFVCLR